MSPKSSVNMISLLSRVQILFRICNRSQIICRQCKIHWSLQNSVRTRSWEFNFRSGENTNHSRLTTNHFFQVEVPKGLVRLHRHEHGDSLGHQMLSTLEPKKLRCKRTVERNSVTQIENRESLKEPISNLTFIFYSVLHFGEEINKLSDVRTKLFYINFFTVVNIFWVMISCWLFMETESWALLYAQSAKSNEVNRHNWNVRQWSTKQTIMNQ